MRINAAQKLLLALGVDHVALFLAHTRGKSPQSRKKGPGRKHQQGKKAQ